MHEILPVSTPELAAEGSQRTWDNIYFLVGFCPGSRVFSIIFDWFWFFGALHVLPLVRCLTFQLGDWGCVEAGGWIWGVSLTPTLYLYCTAYLVVDIRTLD